MLKKLRKSSAKVTLVLIGAAVGGGLAGCSKDEVRRDVYASKQDCLADWGNSPADCEPVNGRSGGGSGSVGHYYGRPYTYTGTASEGVSHSSRAISSTTVSRGGFGGSAHSSGGG